MMFPGLLAGNTMEERKSPAAPAPAPSMALFNAMPSGRTGMGPDFSMGMSALPKSDPKDDEDKRPFLQRVQDFFKDEEKVAKFIMALEPLRGFGARPGAAAGFAETVLQESRARREEGRETQQFIDYLISRGTISPAQAEQLKGAPKLAAALARGSIEQQFRKPAETFRTVTGQQIMDKTGVQGLDPTSLYNVSDLTGKITGVGGADVTNISLDNQGDYSGAFYKLLPEQIQEYVTGGRQARSAATSLMQMERMLANPEFDTGRFAATKQSIRSVFASAGLPVDEDALTQADTFEALTKALVAEELRLNKGPQTDFDARYAGTYNPSLDKDPEANRAIIRQSLSRLLLTATLGEVASDGASGDAETDRKLKSQLDRLANRLGGVVYLENEEGTEVPILFVDFVREAEKQGKSAIDVLTEWRSYH